jgi:hypothetical protein
LFFRDYDGFDKGKRATLRRKQLLAEHIAIRDCELAPLALHLQVNLTVALAATPHCIWQSYSAEQLKHPKTIFCMELKVDSV